MSLLLSLITRNVQRARDPAALTSLDLWVRIASGSGYLVPHQNPSGLSGVLARFDLATFARPEAVILPDLQLTTDLRGFVGGFAGGGYGFLVPYTTLAGGYHGKVVRFNVMPSSVLSSSP